MALPDYYPSLSEDGWVNEPIKIADWIMSDFFSSDYSQTHSHPGQVASFAYILQKYQISINDIMNKLTQGLTIYFSRYFDNVLVEVEDVETDPTIPTRTLAIYIAFTDKKGRRYNLGKQATFEGSKLMTVINVLKGEV